MEIKFPLPMPNKAEEDAINTIFRPIFPEGQPVDSEYYDGENFTDAYQKKVDEGIAVYRPELQLLLKKIRETDMLGTSMVSNISLFRLCVQYTNNKPAMKASFLKWVEENEQR